MKRFLLIIFIVFFIHNAFTQEISSPNKKLKLNFKLSDKGELTYNLMLNNQAVVKDSKLGFRLADHPDFLSGFIIESYDTLSHLDKWKTIYGEVDLIIDNYKQLQITLSQPKEKRKLILTFRLFNDGLGFRYEFPDQENLTYFRIAEEETQFSLTGDHKAFWIPGDYDSQEYFYTTSLLSEVNASIGSTFDGISVKSLAGNNIVQTPLMMKTSEGLYINIHEAALINYPVMYLKIDKNDFVLSTHLCPDAYDTKAYMQTPCKTPWRTIIVSDKAEDILASKIILNLNEPTEYKDISWIKPMKFIGIWWGMHVGKYSWNYADIGNIKLGDVDWDSLKPNGKHGATTANAKRYIDFAAKHKIDALLIEGWNIGWEDWFGNWKENVFDFVTPYPDFNIEEVSKYAKQKNVQLIMHHETSGSVTNYERRMDDAFSLMKKYGYNSVKTGYVGKIIPRGEHHDGQWMVNHFTRVVEKASQYHFCVDSHESVRLTGLHRTYPNWLAAEAARGNEFNAWSRGNPPEHETILPFTRLVGGPMDYTPGIFQIKMDYYNSDSKYQVHTTLAKQLALYITIYSPIQMAADLPENYDRFPDAFSFIEDVPVDWNDTKIIKAEPGDYIIIARKDKNSDNWFLGAITDEEARSFDVELDFLGDGKYKMTMYNDAPDADWINNPMKYEIIKKEVDRKNSVNLNLAPGGGTAVSFKRIE